MCLVNVKKLNVETLIGWKVFEKKEGCYLTIFSMTPRVNYCTGETYKAQEYGFYTRYPSSFHCFATRAEARKFLKSLKGTNFWNLRNKKGCFVIKKVKLSGEIHSGKMDSDTCPYSAVCGKKMEIMV
jgi:hypothetical protein